jgi:plastocyanin
MFTFRLVAPSFVLVFAMACSGTSSSPPSSTPVSPTPVTSPPPSPVAAATSVRIPVSAAQLADRAYVPDQVSVSVGDTVTWLNVDTISHTSTADAGGWNSGTLAPGQRFEFTPRAPGTFTYHCGIHPGMVGTMVVR